MKETYGYDHPPRAVRDVREQGIPIETFSITGKHGRKIAAYRFGDPKRSRRTTHRGRVALPKTLKKELLKRDGARCAICNGQFSATYLQVDHRVPYEVAGDARAASVDLSAFMLVCRSCNRAKSWSCEHCTNWLDAHSVTKCLACYWASPESYEHIATDDIRRIELVWQGVQETRDHADAVAAASHAGLSLPEFVKSVLRQSFARRKSQNDR